MEDAEDDENNPGTRKRYIFPMRQVLAVPKEIGKKLEFPMGHEVLALYPGTSCFYRAEVIQPPSKV